MKVSVRVAGLDARLGEAAVQALAERLRRRAPRHDLDVPARRGPAEQRPSEAEPTVEPNLGARSSP